MTEIGRILLVEDDPIPGDSFIEWRRVDAKTRPPLDVRHEGRLDACYGRRVARLVVTGRQADRNFAIVTTEPNELVVRCDVGNNLIVDHAARKQSGNLDNTIDQVEVSCALVAPVLHLSG